MESYCKVVIIDDEYIMRQGMKHMLDWEKEGFQIVGECSNGQEGLEMIEKVKPDIVLADIVMPVLDGIEFSEILHKKYPQIQLIILSSFDKFEYVRATLLNGAADYILKPTLNPENLLEVLQKTARRIPGMELKKREESSIQGQLERYISGFQNIPDPFIMAQHFPYTLCTLVGIDLKQLCQSQKNKMVEVREYIESYFQEKTEYKKYQMFLEEEILCGIFNFKVKDETRVYEDIKDCARKVNDIFGDAFFVIGNSFSDIKNIKTVYEKGIHSMVGRKFYYKGQICLFSSEYKEMKKEERFQVMKYSDLLTKHHFAEATAMLQEYVKNLIQCQAEEYKLKNQTKNLLYNYLIEMEEFGTDTEKLRRKYFRMIENAEYAEEFEQAFFEIMDDLKENKIEEGEWENLRILEIKTYIKEHYNENLDLTEIATRFNFNYHYLSSYFGRYTKEGFSGYINKIRIEKACELLKQGKYSISEISSMIGYSDHSYFCRVFKKQVHETPSEYKRRMKREQ